MAGVIRNSNFLDVTKTLLIWTLPFLCSALIIYFAFGRQSFPSGACQLFRGGVLSYNQTITSRVTKLALRRATAADHAVIELAKDMMHPPSTNRVKLTAPFIRHTPQSSIVDTILQQKVHGFFIECGAYDGEEGSNTLYLEQKRGWTGLLIEMDPKHYTQLIGKCRKSWSISACLSIHPYVSQLKYIESRGMLGQLLFSGSQSKKKIKMAPCFPLYALLLALNQTSVDYFSLDVEGAELEVLKTIPFDKVNIKVLSVEYLHGRSRKKDYTSYMLAQGYAVYKNLIVRKTAFAHDLVFVRRSLLTT